MTAIEEGIAGTRADGSMVELRVACIPRKEFRSFGRGGGLMETMALHDALQRRWESPALFCSYGVEGETAWPRLAKRDLATVHEKGGKVAVRLLAFDYDLKDQAGKKRGWASVEEANAVMVRLADGGLLPTVWYTTPHGSRMIYWLATAVLPHDAERCYQEMLRRLAAVGIVSDEQTADWTRFFTLPFVTKEDGSQTWRNETIFIEYFDQVLHASELLASAEATEPELAPRVDLAEKHRRNQQIIRAMGKGRREQRCSYAQGLLRGVEHDIECEPEGARNDVLFKRACRAFREANGGFLDANEARERLRAAGLASGLVEDAVEASIESAYRSTRNQFPDIERWLREKDAERDPDLIEAQARAAIENGKAETLLEMVPALGWIKALHEDRWNVIRSLYGVAARRVGGLAIPTSDLDRRVSAAAAEVRRERVFLDTVGTQDDEGRDRVIVDPSNQDQKDIGDLVVQHMMDRSDAQHPRAVRHNGVFCRVDKEEITPCYTQDQVSAAISDELCLLAFSDKGLIPYIPSRQVLASVMHGRRELPPTVHSVCRTPVFVGRGRLVVEGYDPESGVLVLVPKGRSVSFVAKTYSKVAQAQEDARQAVALLRKPTSQLPFDSDASAANYLSLMVWEIVRRTVPSTASPIFDHRAHMPGTGKTLGQECCVIVHGGSMTTLPVEDEETRKKIMSYADRGCTHVGFDNLESGASLHSRFLCALATAGNGFSDRRLGVTGLVEVHLPPVISLSRNNPADHREDARRIVPIGYHRHGAKPEFEVADLKSWMRENRSKQLALLMAWGHAYFSALRLGWTPSTAAPHFPSFEGFAELLHGLLEFGGVPGFLQNLGSEAINESSVEYQLELLLHEIVNAAKTRTAFRLDRFKARDVVSDVPNPEALFQSAEHLAKRFVTLFSKGASPTALGDLFGRFRKNVFDASGMGRISLMPVTGKNGEQLRPQGSLLWAIAVEPIEDIFRGLQ